MSMCDVALVVICCDFAVYIGFQRNIVGCPSLHLTACQDGGNAQATSGANAGFPGCDGSHLRCRSGRRSVANSTMRRLWTLDRKVLRPLHGCTTLPSRTMGPRPVNATLLEVRQQLRRLPLLPRTSMGTSSTKWLYRGLDFRGGRGQGSGGTQSRGGTRQNPGGACHTSNVHSAKATGNEQYANRRMTRADAIDGPRLVVAHHSYGNTWLLVLRVVGNMGVLAWPLTVDLSGPLPRCTVQTDVVEADLRLVFCFGFAGLEGFTCFGLHCS